VLFACENNKYAMGTALAKEHAQTDLALRAASYGMVAWPVDGMDVLAVEEAARHAVEAVRDGAGPHFLELRTYRFRAHSMYDSDRYRPKPEIESWKERDPIAALEALMRADHELDDEGLARMEAELQAALDRAVEEAEQSPPEPVEELTRFVYSEREGAR
jgi:pyruvate dehydrogenase E1 component alpha subunit